jgi:serine/threonine protein kinase
VSKRPAVALVVGIDDYLHADRIPALRFAARDATAMRQVLADPDVGNFSEDGVVLLTGAAAGRDDLVRRLSRWLPERARGAELAVLYFAGHGVVQRDGPRDEGFLLPHDADPDDLVTRGVAMRDVRRWIEGIDAGAVVVCLDCCHAGRIVPHPGIADRSFDRDLEFRPAVLQDFAGHGRFLIASCHEGEKSLESAQTGHGLFTYHLLEGIRGAGDRDGNGKVGVAELFEYVAEAVEKDAREQFNRVQRPWHNSSGPGGDYLSAPRGRTFLPGTTVTAIERPRRGQAAAVIREIDGLPADAGEDQLVPRLRQLGGLADPAAVPVLFRCLAHLSEPVRAAAHQAIQALGWDQTTAVIEDLARQADERALGVVFEGLAAFEAHLQVVGLLDRLTFLLSGNLRNRAILLLERKRLGLEREQISALFREKQSPYGIERVLGQGLFTAAYLARHGMGDLEVVLRVLRPEFVSQPHVRARFWDLSKRSLKFNHQNLVLTRDVGAFPDRHVYYTVRDFIDGVTLQKLLESGKRFEPVQVVKLLRQLLEALTPPHQGGLCHGGVKPSNVFIGGDDRVILGDPSLPVHGIGVALERLSYDYRYAAPEMFRSDGVLGPRADFYALGCVAYELVCGAAPFVSDNYFELATKHDREPVCPPSQRGSRLGRAGDAFLQRLLAKAPADRFGSLDEALEALAVLHEALRPKARPEVPPGSAVQRPAPEPPAPLLHEASLIRYDTRASLLPFSGAEPDTDAGAVQPEESAGGPEQLPKQIGRYQILGLLGRGGMGVVYQARDPALNRLVALKMIQSGGRAHLQTSLRFETEAMAFARLQYPHIVQIYDIGEEAGQAYFALEYVDGGSLARRWDHKPQPAREAAQLLDTLARAVQHAHERGIIHRDLKPANVLLTADGTAKITDFGLAKVTQHNESLLVNTTVGTVMGTPVYMSPEQIEGNTAAIGPLTDIYALGAILYEALTGRPPFWDGSMPPHALYQRILTQGPTPPSQLQSAVPRELDAICLRCLQKDPRRRYASALELAEDLRRFLDGEPVVAPAPHLPQSPTKASVAAPAPGGEGSPDSPPAQPVPLWGRAVRWAQRHWPWRRRPARPE